MKKLYTLLLALTCLFSQVSFSQVVVFSFSGVTGSEASVSSSSHDAGVAQATISRGPGLASAIYDEFYLSTNWTTDPNNPDPNDYLEITVTPSAGYTVTLSSLTMSSERSPNGPSKFVIRTSEDGYAGDATNVVILPNQNSYAPSTFNFSPGLSFNTPLVLRLYGYNAKKSSGNWGPGGGADDITLSGLTVLPVNFFGLKAVRRNNTVEINWSNATEENVQYYSVEKSTDGQHFAELMRQSSQKNNGGAVSYVATDKNPSNGANFYRIRAIELDGSERLSNVLRVDGDQRSAGVNLYPNPVRSGGQFTVQLNGVANGSYQLVLYNMAGAAVKQLNINVSGSSFSQTIQTANLPKGSYLLQLRGQEVISQRLVIQ